MITNNKEIMKQFAYERINHAVKRYNLDNSYILNTRQNEIDEKSDNVQKFDVLGVIGKKDMLYLINKYRKKYKYVEQIGREIIFANDKRGDGSLFPAYVCNDLGVFTEERGHLEKIIDLGSMELNLVGFHCASRFLYGEINKTKVPIMNAKNEKESKAIFSHYFTEEYIYESVVMNPETLVEDRLNVVLEKNCSYSVYWRKGNFICSLGRGRLYATLFGSLYSKKQFEETILPELDLSQFSNKELLELYQIFVHNRSGSIIELGKYNSP